jgi:ADP-dependent NAD(P)H-hydrate dehydratase
MKTKRTIPTPTSTPPALPPRNDATHKGQVGRVLIIAGSRGMSGAACLSAAGALRGGAGLVRVLTPESVQPLVAASDPCLMSVPMPETKAGQFDGKKCGELLEESFAWATVTAIGPGLGQHKTLGEFVRSTLEKFPGPVVLDADGLNNLAPSGSDAWKIRRGKPTVITPHPGEMARLRASAKLDELNQQDDESRLRIAHEYAALANLTVVLKGYRTVVAAPDQTYVNTTGNPGMATGGMGDVLTGLIAALLGQGLSAFDAACLGVHVHGLAGDLCAKNIGPIGFLARDVAETLPAALARLVSQPMGFKP